MADTTEDSARRFNGGGVTWPFAGAIPSEAYPGLATTSNASPTSRVTEGDGVCAGPNGSSRYEKAEGTVTETLSEEDTAQDAMNRALDAAEWGCANPDICCESYRISGVDGVVAFAFTQVKVPMTGLAVGHTYRVTIRIGEKPVGTGGRYIFHGETIEVTFTAVSSTEETDWQDVPVSDLFQYKALYAVLEDIT